MIIDYGGAWGKVPVTARVVVDPQIMPQGFAGIVLTSALRSLEKASIGYPAGGWNPSRNASQASSKQVFRADGPLSWCIEGL